MSDSILTVDPADTSILLGWYWNYCLSDNSQFENILVRIDTLALLTRIVGESGPLVLNPHETGVVDSWLRADSAVAGQFIYLPENQKELIRKINLVKNHNQKAILIQNPLKRESEINVPLHGENDLKRGNGPLSWWKKTISSVRWVLRYFW